MAAPLLRRAWIRAVSWLAPGRSRPAWRARYLTDLANWWTLVERGDLSARTGGELSRRALADAWSERFQSIDVGHILRSPWVVPVAFAAALAAIALLSHGFAVTRAVIDVARDMRLRVVPSYDTRGDRIFVYLAPLLFATATGLALLVSGCLSLRGRGWRYWAFLALKVACVCTV